MRITGCRFWHGVPTFTGRVQSCRGWVQVLHEICPGIMASRVHDCTRPVRAHGGDSPGDPVSWNGGMVMHATVASGGSEEISIPPSVPRR